MPSGCAGLAASEGWAWAKAAILLAATLLCAQTRLIGQIVPADVSLLDPNGCAAPAGNGNGRRWSLAASADTYLVPGARDHVQATLAATRGWLHLEVRYNYGGPRNRFAVARAQSSRRSVDHLGVHTHGRGRDWPNDRRRSGLSRFVELLEGRTPE